MGELLNLHTILTPVLDAIQRTRRGDVSDDEGRLAFDEALSAAQLTLEAHAGEVRDIFTRLLSEWVRDAKNQMGAVLTTPRHRRGALRAGEHSIGTRIGRFSTAIDNGKALIGAEGEIL